MRHTLALGVDAAIVSAAKICIVLICLLVGLGCSSSSEPSQSNPTAAAKPTSAPPPPSLAAPPEPNPNRFVVVAAGDVGFGRGVGRRVLRDPAYDPFEHVRALFDSADLSLVNLESQLADRDGQTVHPRNPLVFVGPPRSAELLSKAGLDAVSVANNHAWDFGKPAFLETLRLLDQQGIAYVGASAERGRAYEPTIMRRRGWSIALFAVTHIWNVPKFHEHPGRHHVAWANLNLLKKRIAAARAQHDVVLVSYHGGGEYIDIPLDYSERFFKTLAGWGVDAVVGHHPHVTQGVAWSDGHPLIYSLGNLVFEPFYTHWTRHGFIARLSFTRGSAVSLSLELCPVEIGAREIPAPLTRQSALAAVRQRLVETSKKVGGSTIAAEPNADGCYIVTPPS